ncbi:MAG: ligase-associated DNA damage response endonuclease PdeM [Rhizobiales bacterium]|nr:ligase-associated DNA damage response endonuclease PdeM [Hyphomicrobiales bacterium]
MILSVAGKALIAHPYGIVFFASEETLIVADLHLEKGAAYARQQVFLPPYDTAATLARLEQAIAAFQPRRVIALGDSFHDAEGPEQLGRTDKDRLAALTQATDWIWVAGNHDPALPRSLGGSFMDAVRLGGLTFRHEPLNEAAKVEDGAKEEAEGEVAGHLHPCVRVRGRGRAVRCRAFVAGGTRLILPAFGALAGGLNVRDPAFAHLVPERQFQVYALGSDRLFPVAPAACLAD